MDAVLPGLVARCLPAAGDLPPGVEVGLVVFGHRGSPRDSGRDTSCATAEPVVPLSPAGRAAVLSAVDRLRPLGWTPLAAAIYLTERPIAQILVVVVYDP